MRLLRDLLSVRVNLLIVAAGAFVVILLIKLTSLLPQKYYFSFSTLYGKDKSPFLVEPPSVSGKKLCDIMRRNRIDISSTSLSEIKCTETEATPSYGLTLAQKDKVYDVAIRTDEKARAALTAASQGFAIQPLSPEQFASSIQYSQSVKSAFDSLVDSQERALKEAFLGSFLQSVGGDYAGVDAAATPGNDSDVDAIRSDMSGLSMEQRQRIAAAYHQATGRIAAINLAQITPERIRKSQIDEALTTVYSGEDAANRIFATYLPAYSGEIRQILEQAFVANGLTLSEDRKAVEDRLFGEIVRSGWENYLIAALVRILPVLFFGLVLGLVFGAREIVSISLAAGVAAFLLSWPVMLMWDTVVTGSWADKKSVFIAFYAGYVVAFYLTAKLGAVFGAFIRQRLPGGLRYRAPEGEALAPGSLISIGYKDLALNVMGGLGVNVLVYAFNLIIPFMANA